LSKKLFFLCGETEFIAFLVAPELKRELERIANDEQRALSQICEMFLYEGVESSPKNSEELGSTGSVTSDERPAATTYRTGCRIDEMKRTPVLRSK
jgi:hypothetical protein